MRRDFSVVWISVLGFSQNFLLMTLILQLEPVMMLRILQDKVQFNAVFKKSPKGDLCIKVLASFMQYQSAPC